MSYIYNDAVAWVRAGRPNDISAFKKVHTKSRLALLKALQATDI